MVCQDPFWFFFKKIFSTFTAPWLPYALDRVSLRVLPAISIVLPLLYHTLRGLSRGFLKKFRTFFIISATRHFSGLFLFPAMSLTAPWMASLKEIDFNGYWLSIRFCFCCPQCLGLSPPRFPSLTPLLYHILGDLSRGFYIFFRFRSPELPQLGSGFHLPLTPLLYHTLRGLSRGKSKFFQLFFALILSVLLLLSGVTFTPQFAFPLDNDSIPYPPSRCK